MNTTMKHQKKSTASNEAKVFVLVCAVIIPLITLIGIFGYGFVIWVMQIFNGPPT